LFSLFPADRSRSQRFNKSMRETDRQINTPNMGTGNQDDLSGMLQKHQKHDPTGGNTAGNKNLVRH